MSSVQRAGLGVTLVVLVGFAMWATAGPATTPDEHPEVEGAVTPSACDVCHKEVTPSVVAHWYYSKHGELGVKCFVCHGSTGQDFTVKPDATRCIGCHADHVASMESPFMKDKTCFTCHPSHILVPHPPADHEGGGE